MKRGLWVAVLVSAVVLGGCWSEPGPEGPQLQFQADSPSCATVEEYLFVAGAAGQIVFQGNLHVPTPCYILTAQLVPLRCGCCRCPNTYQVRLIAAPLGDVCTECLGQVPFVGAVRGLPPGTYTLAVVVVVNGEERPARVFTVEVK